MVWRKICAGGRTPWFFSNRGSSLTGCVSMQHPLSRCTFVNSAAVCRCGMDAPAGLHSGPQSEKDSGVVQSPIHRFHYICRRAAVLSEYKHDGLQRMIDFEGHSLCQTSGKFGDGEVVNALGVEQDQSGEVVADSRKTEEAYEALYRFQSRLLRKRLIMIGPKIHINVCCCPFLSYLYQ